MISLSFRSLLIPLFFLAASSASASVTKCDLIGKVVTVVGGDMIEIVDPNKRKHRIRLAGIDAPEKAQTYGRKARQFLSDNVYRQAVCVVGRAYDAQGRLLGKVMTGNVSDSQLTDMNLQMVSAGLAWYDKHGGEHQSNLDRYQYAQAERDAKRARDGLWQKRDAVAPWAYRARVASVGQKKPAITVAATSVKPIKPQAITRPTVSSKKVVVIKETLKKQPKVLIPDVKKASQIPAKPLRSVEVSVRQTLQGRNQRLLTVVKPVAAAEQTFRCLSKLYCVQMNSCAEAQFYLNTCGMKRLDDDGNGQACDALCQ